MLVQVGIRIYHNIIINIYMLFKIQNATYSMGYLYIINIQH